MKRHYDADNCSADSISSAFTKTSLKISRLSYRLYFLQINSRNISVYDDIKIETSLCFSSVVRRVSTNFSDNPRTEQDLWCLCTRNMLRASYPSLLTWRGGGYDFPMLKTSRLPHVVRDSEIVTDCLLTRSMLIKMYEPVHDMRMYMHMIFTFNSAQSRGWFSLASLSDCMNVFFFFFFFTTILSLVLIPVGLSCPLLNSSP